MRAMIMAAGLGTRLMPLTGLVPKPMAPIANRPALEHILRLLRRHGITEVVVNLHHFPEAITELLRRRLGAGCVVALRLRARAAGDGGRGQEQPGVPG